MVGLRCVPTRLFTKLENPLFFFIALPSRPSSLYLCLGLRIPLGSPRGELRSSMSRPVAARLCERRTAGLATAVLRAELKPELSERKVCDARGSMDSPLSCSVGGRGGGAVGGSKVVKSV